MAGTNESRALIGPLVPHTVIAKFYCLKLAASLTQPSAVYVGYKDSCKAPPGVEVSEPRIQLF